MTTATEKKKPRGAGRSTGEVTTIPCAFCGATGRDPYKILSRLADCPVCKGRKMVQIQTPTVVCAYCRGTGRQRHTRLTCSACRGKGASTLAGPTTKCPQCAGTGREPEADLACALCKGAGLIARKRARGRKNSAAAKARAGSKGQ